MKLLDKYNRISFLTTILVMVLTGIVYYFTVSIILTNQIDKSLVVEENEIFDYVRLNQRLPQVFKSTDLMIFFKPIKRETIERRFINTGYRKNPGKEIESARALISSVKVKGVNYQIQIIESKVETEDLIQIIFLITLGVIVTLIATLFIINRLVLRKLWKPFYQTLQQLKLFNLTDKNTLTGLHSEIEEFKELNVAVTAMASRVKDDYQELKTFIENAAHELMTPVAVINSKLDILIQGENLSEMQSELLSDIYETVTKLTRLNRAMLLLSKIENKLIRDDASLNVKEAVEESLSQFHELFINKNLTVKSQLTDVWLTTSESLFDVLLNNLLSNAVRHNEYGGYIEFVLERNRLSIKNTGKPYKLHDQLIFQRFNKSAESEGSGLGLTLSRQICENYGYRLEYHFRTPYHIFEVYFN